jgi:uncharacterized protein
LHETGHTATRESGRRVSGVDIALWRRLDRPGHEAARLVHHPPFWQLGGTAVFLLDRACRLEYQIVCDAAWRTLHARVTGWHGADPIKVEIYTDAARRWMINGQAAPSVAGCIDLDLSFSPATNAIPIRRLTLNGGERAEVRSAWLKFPGLALEPLVQTYLCTSDSLYHYESSGGEFVTDIEVDAAGLPVRYPPLWEREPGG